MLILVIFPNVHVTFLIIIPLGTHCLGFELEQIFAQFPMFFLEIFMETSMIL